MFGLGRLARRATRLRAGGMGRRFAGKKKNGNHQKGPEVTHHLFGISGQGNLRITQNGRVDACGGKGLFARFTLLEVDPPADGNNGDSKGRTMMIRVPSGVSEGQEIRFHTPEGVEMKAIVPANLPADRNMTVFVSSTHSPAVGDHMYVCLRSAGNPENCLHMGEQSISGGGVPTTSETIFRIEKKLGQTKIYHPASRRYLHVTPHGNLKPVSSPAEASTFEHHTINAKGGRHMQKVHQVIQNEMSLPSRPVHTAKLSREEIIQFRDHGYIVARDAVSQDLLEDALRKINQAIEKGQHGGTDVIDANGLHSDGEGRFSKDVRLAPEIVSLFRRSKVWSLVESLVGPESLVPPKWGQVALRYPLPKGEIQPLPRCRYHIDGEFLPRFTLLVGVVLSPWQVPFCGNFTVFPGKADYIITVIMD